MVLVILPVIRTARSVGSHLECLTRNAVRPANFQQSSQAGPCVVEDGLRETESLRVRILCTYGSVSAQEKVVILFGKALKGKINEYSE